MDNDRKKKDDWVRQASKSHPGRYYLFNKATGETKWLPLTTENDEKQKEQEPPPKLSIKASKTPAQDRLKRLQNSLKLSQTKSNTSETETKKLKDRTNESNDAPTTSRHARPINKSQKKAVKRSHNETVPQIKKAAKYSVKDFPKTLPPDSSADSCTENKSVEVGGSCTEEASTSKNPGDNKILPSPDSSEDRCTQNESIGVGVICKGKASTPNELDNKTLPPHFLAHGSTKNDGVKLGGVCRVEKSTSKELEKKEDLQNSETKGSILTNIRSSIVKKIKGLFKIPFNAPTNIADENSLSKNNNSSGILNTAKFKTVNPSKTKLSTATQEAIVKQIREESTKSPENKIFTSSHDQITPKSQNIPSYSRGSANSRLERLKQSLITQQKYSCTKRSSDTSNQNDNRLNVNESSINDEVEAMDWQPITNNEKPNENMSFEPTIRVEKSQKCLLREVNVDENLTMGDIIDTVNENLLRFSAEKQNESIGNKREWRKDFYYFIVDTNVLLKDLTFIEDLSKMKLCETKGSMLYIPYAVLQELDKLKMRFGSQEGPKTLAVRAIKYLNSKLANNSSHVQAQSAVEERRRFIDVNSADDSIVNCCLQVKEHIPNLLFLTEDVNLRNKAICNDIIVSTRSDLIAKRYDDIKIS